MAGQTPNGESPRGSDFAALWSSDGVTRSFGATGTGLPADLPYLFAEGQRLGGYVVVRPIGKGGMGQVYEAEETESGRRVAVKILSRGLGDDEERARFLREGQLAASLSHPNCVYVFGTSEEQVRKADEVVAGLLESSSRGLMSINTPVILWAVVAFIAGGAAAAVAVLGLIGAVAARGGVTLRLFGAALVTADGRDASRMRALVRACIAWSPLALWFLMMRYGPPVQRATVGVALLYTLALALLIAGAIWAWLHPSRGIQDRLAGTWIVPR